MLRRLVFVCLILTSAPALAGPPRLLKTDRAWEVFKAPKDDGDRREILERAATMLEGWSVELGGVPVTPARLRRIASAPASEPLVRAAREELRRPVDLDDFLLFLDDLVLGIGHGLEPGPVVLPPARARNAGILLHPNDVYRKDRARRYGAGGGKVDLSAPVSQDGLRPAKDGAVVGPRWAARYQQPETEAGRIVALAKVNPDFARRVKSLVTQLRRQGAWTEVESTLRARERGFLIYGSYWLSKANSAQQVAARIKRLDQLEQQWGLKIPVRWRRPGSWRETVRGARRLAETYGVDYASRGGAKSSKHYDGVAADIWAVDLPREVTLEAPDGAKRTFDLSGADEPRDLSLTPALVDWIEEHFRFRKLRTDYPHWTDAAEEES